MTLEELEQKTLSYLKQVSNPLVTIEQLLRHLRLEDEVNAPSREDLLSFLRDHELFRVIEPAGMAESPEGSAALSEYGLRSEPSVILSTRTPSPAELSNHLQVQMFQVADALVKALEEARSDGDPAREQAIRHILEKAQTLQQKLLKALNDKPGPDQSSSGLP